jgi:hypothetical protein
MDHSSKGVLTTFVFLPLLAFAQQQPASPIDHHEPRPLEGIQVSGTRLPTESVIRISGLKVGEMINDETLKQASDKLTSTGLVKGLDYGYNIVPGKSGVYLTINVFDEGPLLPARIYPPEEAQSIWTCLRSADPIFIEELPNTEKAIHFYSINMARCLGNSGAARDRLSATVACDGSGKSIAIDFHVRPNGAAAAAR